jgi:hypothetical protein
LTKSAEFAAAAEGLKTPAKADKVKTFDSKERRQERARQRQELAAAKKDAEKLVQSIEKKLEKLQIRQNELALLLADPQAKINFQMTNRELFDIQQEIAAKTLEWEEAALKLEEIIESNS